MSELISGKEAKLAWANGEELQIANTIVGEDFYDIDDSGTTLNIFDLDFYKFRLKPKTITLNGIEVPKIPVKADLYANGNSVVIECDNDNDADILRDALRSIFKGE